MVVRCSSQTRRPLDNAAEGDGVVLLKRGDDLPVPQQATIMRVNCRWFPAPATTPLYAFTLPSTPAFHVSSASRPSRQERAPVGRPGKCPRTFRADVGSGGRSVMVAPLAAGYHLMVANGQTKLLGPFVPYHATARGRARAEMKKADLARRSTERWP